MMEVPPPSGQAGSTGSDGGGQRGSWAGISRINDLDCARAALTYASAGIPVFPLFGAVWDDRERRWRCECGRECDRPAKHPRVKWTQAATTDIEQVKEWWTRWPTANIGMPTGSKLWPGTGLVAVDLDRMTLPDGTEADGADELAAWLEQLTGEAKLPDTLEAGTPGRGRHLIFVDPGGIRVITAMLPGVDLRGDGGYIVLPPSRGVKNDGAVYSWANELAPATLERRVADRLRLARGTAGGGTRTAPGGGAGAGPGYDYTRAKVEGPPAGARDEFFNSFSFELWMAGWEKDAILGRLHDLWLKTPQPKSDPYTWETVVEKVERVVTTVEREEPVEVTEEMRRWAAAIAAQKPAPDEPTGDAPVDSERDTQDHTTVSPEEPSAPEEDSEADTPADIEPDVALDNVVSLAERRGGGSGGGSDDGGDDGGGDDDGAGLPGEPGEYDFITQLTEAGVAERYVSRFGSRLMHVSGLGWHHWDDVHWRHDSTGMALHLTRDIIRDLAAEQAGNAGNDEAVRRYAQFIERMSRTGTRSAVVKAASVDPRMSADVDELNADPWLLVVRNGTLDLRTGRVRGSDPADRCTQVAAVAYDEAASCPRWLDHVRLITTRADGTPDADLAAFLQRWAGYTLTGLVSEQKFAFCFGGGSNGKNAFIETLMKIMGGYATTASSQVLTGGGQEHQTIIADLAGPRLVFVDETPRGMINEARLKQLTGTGKIRARKIAKDSFEFDARFKLWIAGNNKPRIAETSEGMWRRLDLIPFDATIPPGQRVKDFADILARDEGPGILNWALEGLAAYRELGTLGAPQRVLDAVQVYREEEDPFGQFVSDTFQPVIPSAPQRVWHPNKVIVHLYKEWLRDTMGVTRDSISMRSLTNDLLRCHFERDDKVRKVRWAWGGVKAERGWFGPPLLVGLPSELVWS